MLLLREYRSTGYEYWIAKTGDADLYNLYYYEAAEEKTVPLFGNRGGPGRVTLRHSSKSI